MSQELAVTFPCGQQSLIGVLHRPNPASRVGVVIVVGGPQYRIGSHRQFIQLARHLAARGYAVLRFDCRGMGDSGGEFPGFEWIADDIAAAIDTLCAQVGEVEQVVLWGLCDAASAALMYAKADQRIGGLILINPYVRSEATLAKTYLRHYYLARLMSQDFWSKLLSGRMRPAVVVGDLADNIRASRGPVAHGDRRDFVTRMRDGLGAFAGPVLIVLSGNDITAAEFAVVSETPDWRRVLQRPGVTRQEVTGANHTFSTAAWRNQVAELTAGWLRTLDNGVKEGPG